MKLISAARPLPLRRRRRRTLLQLRIVRGAWHAASEHQRDWACWQISQLLRDLQRGYHPRAAIARARRGR